MVRYTKNEDERIRTLVKKLGEDIAETLVIHDDHTHTLSLKAKNRVMAGTRVEALTVLLALISITPANSTETEWTIRFGFIGVI